jgi:hypothetical protein
MPNAQKKVLDMRPQITPGKSRGSMFLLLTKTIEVKCKNPECGKVFTTKFPMKDHCSKPCQRRLAYLRRVARESQ